MSQRAFNSCILDGVTVPIATMVTGSGVLDSIGYDKSWTTLNHCIRNVRISTLSKAKFQVYGDLTSLNTQSRVTDDDNFGGTQQFYYDSTLIDSFDGLVTAEYDSDSRLTNVSIRSENNG